MSAFPLAGCFLPLNYRAREAPAAFFDETGDITWQPDVYTHALAVARELKVAHVVDYGCGAARKLGPIVAEFPTYCYDCDNRNLAHARQAHPAAAQLAWLDLDAPVPVNLYRHQDGLVIAADVIEHLLRPRRLLERCQHARAIILSTPDRDRTHGMGHLGPPPNPAHVREWNLDEFLNLLHYSLPGFDIVTQFTRSNDRDPALNTILATCRRRAS